MKKTKIFLSALAVLAVFGFWMMNDGGVAQAQTTGSSTVIVVKNVINSSITHFVPADFFIGIGGNAVSTTTIRGNASGTAVTMNPGTYAVVELPVSGIQTTYSAGCSGTIAANQTVTCTITNTVLGNATTTPTSTPTTTPPVITPNIPETGVGNPYIYIAIALMLAGGTGLVLSRKLSK